MKLAIFDIDGTVVRGSSERLFWRYLLRRGRLGPEQMFAYLLFLVRYVATGGVHTIKKNKAYLTGLRSVEVAALAREFVATRLVRAALPARRAEARATLAARRHRRVDVRHVGSHRAGARRSPRRADRLRHAVQ